MYDGGGGGTTIAFRHSGAERRQRRWGAQPPRNPRATPAKRTSPLRAETASRPSPPPTVQA